MALPMRSMSYPIKPYELAINSGYALRVPSFGETPFRRNGLAGVGCGCDPVGGCGCTKGSGLRAADPGISFLDFLKQGVESAVNTFSDPCNPNSPVFDAARCAAGVSKNNPWMQWLPYVIGGIIIYKLIK